MGWSTAEGHDEGCDCDDCYVPECPCGHPECEQREVPVCGCGEAHVEEGRRGQHASRCWSCARESRDAAAELAWSGSRGEVRP